MSRAPALLIVLSLSAAGLAAAGAPGRAHAALACPSTLPNCPSSVSGKPGPYVKQIAKQKAAAPAKPAGGGETALNLAAHALNRGEVTAAVIKMPITEALLDQLVQKLRAAWPYPDPPVIRVRMRASTDYAAAAHPDNTIVVDFGLIRMAQSDDELAWVIGHETGHLLLDHFTQDQQAIERLQALRKAGEIATIGTAFSQARVQPVGAAPPASVADQRALQREQAITEAKSEELRDLLNLIDPVFGRNQEDQADAIGMDLALAAGFAADEGAARAFDVLIDADARQKATIRSLQSDIAAAGKASATPKAVNSFKVGDVTGAMNGFWGSFKDSMMQLGTTRTMDFVTKNHRPPLVRKTSLAAYFNAAYPSQAPLDVSDKLLKKIRSSAEYREADIAVTAHDVAQAKRIEGDNAAALAAIQKAFKTRYAGYPFVANEAGSIYEQLGDTKEANRRYEQADMSGAQTLDGYQLHIGLMVRLGQYPAALAKIREAQNRLGDHEAFLPSLIVIALRQNKADEAEQYLRECIETENKDLTKACEYALLNPADLQKVQAMPPEQRARIDRSLDKAGSRISTKSALASMNAAMKPQPGT